MPYRRRTYRRRRRSYRKRPSDLMTFAKAGYRLARKAWYRLNSEKNFVATSVTATPAGTWSFSALGLLATGNTTASRVGNQIKFVSHNMNIRIVMNASASDTFVRIVLFLDKQPNGALPGATSVFNTDTIDSFVNINNGRRFVMMMNKVYNVSTGSKTTLFIQKWMKYQFKTRYAGTTAAITDLATNSCVLGLISSEATNTPTVEFNIRQRYFDN